MKRFLAILLSAALAVSMLAGCVTYLGAVRPEDATIGLVGGFTPGTFTATVPAYRGELTVETVFSFNRIESVTVVSHTDFANFAETPVRRIPAQIVAYQSLDIDAVAGSTVTSMAIMFAVHNTVMEAGGDIMALRAPRPRPEANAPVTLNTDVLVVGSGIAGLAAAIEAANAGARVLVIEKKGAFGGATATSGGIIQGGANSILLAHGVEDTAGEFEAFLHGVGHGRNDPDMIRHIANTSADTIDRLMDMGVVFQSTPHISFYRFEPYRAVETYGRGYEITMPMIDFARAMGVEFMMETPAHSLITDNGAVVGANATDITGGAVTIYADSVILATGGFMSNAELMARYHPLITPFSAFNLISSMGDGLRMGVEVGAATLMRDTAIASITAANRGVFVTPSGERFYDESGYGLSRSNELVERGYSYLYAILDSAHLNDALEAALADGRAVQADSLEELAAILGMVPCTLTANIARYNYLAAMGADLDFGKPPHHLQAIGEGPFYAQRFAGFTVFGTMGGLMIDLDGHVLDTNGNRIPGLFAAGEVANGQFMPRDYGGSGMALCLYANMARLAGRAAAQ